MLVKSHHKTVIHRGKPSHLFYHRLYILHLLLHQLPLSVYLFWWTMCFIIWYSFWLSTTTAYLSKLVEFISLSILGCWDANFHGNSEFSLSNSFCNSFGDSANYDASFNTAAFNTSSSKNDRYTFWVCKLNKRITTCFGCRGKFTRAADGSLPVAPLDMILWCNESGPYYDRDGMLKEKENASTYYHPNISWIKMKYKDFQVKDIQLDEDVRCTFRAFAFQIVAVIVQLLRLIFVGFLLLG